MYWHFSVGNGQPTEPALCQLYRRTFVPHTPSLARPIHRAKNCDERVCLSVSQLACLATYIGITLEIKKNSFNWLHKRIVWTMRWIAASPTTEVRSIKTRSRILPQSSKPQIIDVRRTSIASLTLSQANRKIAVRYFVNRAPCFKCPNFTWFLCTLRVSVARSVCSYYAIRYAVPGVYSWMTSRFHILARH